MELRAAGLIIFRRMCKEIEYLLLQTSYGCHHWTPPKGLLDNGESELDAAMRETLEESGYSNDDLVVYPECKKVLKYIANGKSKVVTYWLAELSNNKPVQLSNEHNDYKWAKLSEACRLVEYNDIQEALTECEDFLRNNQTNTH